jgi:hypothetical protein
MRVHLEFSLDGITRSGSIAAGRAWALVTVVEYNPGTMQTLYEAAGGREGVLKRDMPAGLRIPKWSWHGLVGGASNDDT